MRLVQNHDVTAVFSAAMCTYLDEIAALLEVLLCMA
jgi:hypothetical protein